ncbi:hypothetical protein [Streptomyces smyrnaeus]|uniref:hypothetical protein n=2 Tax=Streptomyces smyrnaeus TaxID=1387713 RepID=UPI0036A9C937
MSTRIPRERLQRARAAHAERLRQAVADGRLARDVAAAMMDPRMTRWRASVGFAVVDDFARLSGPAENVVKVPAGLVWGDSRAEVAVTDRRRLRELYRVVLADGTADQQAAILNPDLLCSFWQPGLAEAPIMDVWESRFPQLVEGR